MFLVVVIVSIWILFRTQKPRNRAIVAVLGDVGRSPRMQNHACSLLQHGFKVDILGYRGSKPLQLLTLDQNAHFHYLDQPKKLSIGKLKFVVGGIYRVVKQILEIVFILMTIPKPRFMMIQNPPAIPTLIIFQFISLLRGIPLVIDWHNFGFSIMKVSGLSGGIVRIAEIYERFLGRFAALHITVTKAMKHELEQWPVVGIVAVLYDRPPVYFSVLSDSQKTEFLKKIDFSNQELLKKDAINNETSLFNRDKTAIIISSTSWTEDEDFSILLEALVIYDKQYHSEYPNLCVILTGKGPLKDFYMKKVQELELKHVKIHTAWLEPEDYPTMLGCADIGISLHSSSSGLDLPMKVVDMFGVGLPVLALDFACIGELVIDNENGYTFTTSTELHEKMLLMLKDFPNENSKRFRNRILEFRAQSWQRNWDENLEPILSRFQ